MVVGGNVGHVSGFMAQRGRLVVCGDAGPGLGDSLYEAVIYVRGKIHGLGADAREEEFSAADRDVALDPICLSGTERYVRDLTVKRLPGVSHWVQQDAPQVVNELLQEFLA